MVRLLLEEIRDPGSAVMNGFERLLRAGREELTWDPRKVAVRALSSSLPQHGFNRIRTHLLIAAGVRIGAGSAIAGPLRITGPGTIGEFLSIGEASFIRGPLHIDLGAPVRIGSRVYVGDDVKLLTGTHEIGPPEQRCDERRFEGIEIGDGSWIGSGVTVLPGVQIGHGAIVGAGAVVTMSVAPDAVFAGVPARLVRALDPTERTLTPSSSLRIRAVTPIVRAVRGR